MRGLIAFGIAVAAWFPLAWFRAFVICRLWAWFITPAFHIGPIAMVTAIGISLIVSLLTFQVNGYKYSEDSVENMLSLVIHNALMSLVTWCGGAGYLWAFS